MIQATFTLTAPASPSPAGFWLDISTVGTPLEGIGPGTPLILNPTAKAGFNLTSGHLISAFVSAPDVISFACKALQDPIDILVTVPA